MALRLRRDVQKASYYVWFLGAQEARGLRGPRVLYPAVPRLLERSRDQEPLKVTLQVSHKGLKIVQGTAKHFIPHGAITCTMRGGDVVACVLLLYNPATRCPLHVHAYRCDSEGTAEALQAQLQVLVDRPENQRRFAELETRLGLGSAAGTAGVVAQKQTNNAINNQQQHGGSRRFDSSLGSDTGTSTRESDCSEEPPPLGVGGGGGGGGGAPASLYDSLAAELRQKLGAGGNGGGPPILLPPRDYDTVHRSQGNLTAIELRRCRTSAVVGATVVPPNGGGAGLGMGAVPPPPLGSPPARGVSSRGSSGFGSDPAAPDSPAERRDRHNSCSSDEEWNNEIVESSVFLMHEQKRVKPSLATNQKQSNFPIQDHPYQNHHRDLHRDHNRSISPVREEKPIRYHRRQSPNTRPQYDNYELHENNHHVVSPRKYKDYTPRYRDEIIPYKDEMRYRKSVDLDDLYNHEQQDILNAHHEPQYIPQEIPKYNKNNRREPSLTREEDLLYENENNSKYIQDYRQEYLAGEPIVAQRYRFKPVVNKYQSGRDYKEREYVKSEQYRDKYEDGNNVAKYRQSRITLAEDRQRAPSVNSGSGASILASPRDRFKDAKEKFQMMERNRQHQQQDLVKPRKPKKDNGRAWSSDEEDIIHYRPRPNLRRHVSSVAPNHHMAEQRIMMQQQQSKQHVVSNNKMNHNKQHVTTNNSGANNSGNNPQPHPRSQPANNYLENDRRISASKSLGNLVKGYRHSYAEPQPATRRQINGRVGIAAVHQY